MYDKNEGLGSSFDKLKRYTRAIYLLACNDGDNEGDFDSDDLYTLLLPIMDGLDAIKPFFKTGEKFIQAWEEEVYHDQKAD